MYNIDTENNDKAVSIPGHFVDDGTPLLSTLQPLYLRSFDGMNRLNLLKSTSRIFDSYCYNFALKLYLQISYSFFKNCTMYWLYKRDRILSSDESANDQYLTWKVNDVTEEYLNRMFKIVM